MQSFTKFALRVALKLFAAHWERLEQTSYGHSSTALSMVDILHQDTNEPYQTERTCRAARPLLLVSLPCLSNSSTVPIGASDAVAVKTVAEADSAHSEESASPLKPKVLTEVRSVNDDNFDV